MIGSHCAAHVGFLRTFLTLVFAMAVLVPAHESAATPNESLANEYYRNGEYTLARIEYERELRANPEDGDLTARLGLTFLRLGDFRSGLMTLENQEDFTHHYLSLFAALRAGMVHRALSEQSSILDLRAPYSSEQREQARLLGGALDLEEADYSGATRYFTLLQREANSTEVREAAGGVLTALRNFEERPSRNPLLAGALSAVLPGSGQVYAAHYVDGVAAFFFNGMFLGSAIVTYDLERRAGSGHVASSIFGLVGLIFYLANVNGAVQSAYRYNNFQVRQFHERVREEYFNMDYVERVSGIEIFRESF